MTLSRNMLEVSKAMHADPDPKALIHHSTAFALVDRGLVYLYDSTGYPQETMSGNFPHHLVYLTDAGRMFCTKRFREEKT